MTIPEVPIVSDRAHVQSYLYALERDLCPLSTRPTLSNRPEAKEKRRFPPSASTAAANATGRIRVPISDRDDRGLQSLRTSTDILASALAQAVNSRSRVLELRHCTSMFEHLLRGSALVR